MAAEDAKDRRYNVSTNRHTWVKETHYKMVEIVYDMLVGFDYSDRNNAFNAINEMQVDSVVDIGEEAGIYIRDVDGGYIRITRLENVVRD